MHVNVRQASVKEFRIMERICKTDHRRVGSSDVLAGWADSAPKAWRKVGLKGQCKSVDPGKGVVSARWRTAMTKNGK
jgi:hypothetical protein